MKPMDFDTALDLDTAFGKPLVSGRLEVQTMGSPFRKSLKQSFLQGPLDLGHVQEGSLLGDKVVRGAVSYDRAVG